MLINTASAVFFAGGLWTTYRRRFWPMMLGASAALLLKLWYIDRMVFYYERHRDVAGGEPSGSGLNRSPPTKEP